MLKRYALVFSTIIFLLTAQQGIASQPVLNGHLEGVELCAQFQCGVAVFVGQFKGQVDNNRGKGGFLVLVNHQSLPASRTNRQYYRRRMEPKSWCESVPG
jgi:hypothetical protein